MWLQFKGKQVEHDTAFVPISRCVGESGLSLPKIGNSQVYLKSPGFGTKPSPCCPHTSFPRMGSQNGPQVQKGTRCGWLHPWEQVPGSFHNLPEGRQTWSKQCRLTEEKHRRHRAGHRNVDCCWPEGLESPSIGSSMLVAQLQWQWQQWQVASELSLFKRKTTRIRNLVFVYLSIGIFGMIGAVRQMYEGGDTRIQWGQWSRKIRT